MAYRVLIRLTAAFVVAGALAACSSAPPPPPSPQLLELTLGQSRRVMQARASVWFARPDEEWREDLGQVALGVRVEIRCGSTGVNLVVFKDKPTDPVCGIRLQLLRLEEPDLDASPSRPIRAYFRVSPA